MVRAFLAIPLPRLLWAGGPLLFLVQLPFLPLIQAGGPTATAALTAATSRPRRRRGRRGGGRGVWVVAADGAVRGRQRRHRHARDERHRERRRRGRTGNRGDARCRSGPERVFDTVGRRDRTRPGYDGRQWAGRREHARSVASGLLPPLKVPTLPGAVSAPVASVVSSVVPTAVTSVVSSVLPSPVKSLVGGLLPGVLSDRTP